MKRFFGIILIIAGALLVIAPVLVVLLFASNLMQLNLAANTMVAIAAAIPISMGVAMLWWGWKLAQR